uniref:HMG box domain-containing protein n=1 Tax=viral metagenome TaxID=1070528 RepID=A0A6C0C9C2_9ZZZZ
MSKSFELRKSSNNQTFDGQMMGKNIRPAAMKILTILMKDDPHKNDTDYKITFSVCEVSSGRIYNYVGYRTKMDQIRTYVTKDGTTLTFEYKNVMKTDKSVAKCMKSSHVKKFRSSVPTAIKSNLRCRGNRYFKMIDPKTLVSCGRYKCSSPKQAASKGFTKLAQKYKKNGESVPENLIIYLREMTRGSSGKIYGYTVQRQKLDRPCSIQIGDRTVCYEYKNKVTKINNNDLPIQIQNKKKAKKNKVSKVKKGKKCKPIKNVKTYSSSDDESEQISSDDMPARKGPGKKYESSDESCDDKFIKKQMYESNVRPKKVCVSSNEESDGDDVKRPTKICFSNSNSRSSSSEDDEAHAVRPPTTYNTFIKERIAVLKKDDPTASQIDLLKQAAEEWQKKKRSFEDIVKRNPANFGKSITGPSNIEFSDSEDDSTNNSIIKIKYVKPYFMDAIHGNESTGEWTIEQDEKMLSYLKHAIENQECLSDTTNDITIDEDNITSCELLLPTDKSSCGIFYGQKMCDIVQNVAMRLIKCGDYHNITSLVFAKLVLYCKDNNMEYVYHLNKLNNNTYTIKIISAATLF